MAFFSNKFYLLLLVLCMQYHTCEDQGAIVCQFSPSTFTLIPGSNSDCYRLAWQIPLRAEPPHWPGKYLSFPRIQIAIERATPVCVAWSLK